MNKDLDARLVPNGEYRDALGININQSEGPDVGALEVVLGNEEVFSLANSDMRFIGRFDDSINNVIYLFATDHTGSSEAPPSSTHQILRFVQGSPVPEILVEGYFLNFSQDNIITGISLLETQLFFTDNRNQPRVIDVTNALGYYTKEEHVSVAKFAPYKSISVLYTQTKEVTSFSPPSTLNFANTTNVQVGDIVYNETQNAEYGHVESLTPTSITVDKDLTLATQQPPGYTTAFVPAANDSIRISRSTMSDESSDPNFPGDVDFLEDKFARFSYRFKYDNNEYSLVAPWTQPIFIPKQFGFFAERIYGGATVFDELQNEENAFRSTILNWFNNLVNQVELRIPFPSNNPVDDYKIKQVEILFKESDAVQQQILERVPIAEVTFDTYKPDQNYYKYTYQSKKPYRTLPESVTTRVSDKIPVQALAQELISNRVVYGNFADRWDPPVIEYTTQSGPRQSEFSNDVAEYPNHTLKQNRNYSVGVVFYDKYGRASSVITSSLFDPLADKISTLYHPYKDEGDVGYGGFLGEYRVYDWLGDQLRINFQQPVPEFPVNNYPGAYAQGTTFTLDVGNTTAITNTAPFTYIIVGGDFTAEMPENNYLRGYYVDYTKIISSTFSGGATEIITEEQIADIYEYTGGYPGLGTLEPKRAYKINPAGWYSFRIVVQQQEQDYYNVYLPGLTNGFPWNGFEIVSPPSGAANVPLNQLFPQNVNRIVTTPLISDNINKVPRDLSEVGPDQEQYRSSSTKLFLRVNNTGNLFDVVRLATGTGYSDATNVPTSGGSGSGLTVNITTTAGSVDTVGIYELGYGYQDGDVITISGGSGTATARLDIQDERNQLYFPGREDHYVAQIGKQQEVLDATGQSDPGNTLLSKYIPYDGYYSSESNPLIAVIELNNTESPGVTYQQWFATRPLLPRLCVYETEPQESVLDIYWETSTNGLLSDLNDLITTTFDGVLTLSGISTNFRESVDYGATPSAVTDIFYAIDSTGGNISNVIIDIIQVIDGDGAIIQTDSTPLADRTFTINQNILPSGDELEIFCQKNFTFRDTSTATDVYTVTMQTTFAGETTTHDRIIPLQNDCPSFILSGSTSGFNVFDILDTDKDVTPIISLQNGSQPGADPFPENRIVQLNIEIINEQRVSPGPTVDTNIFTLDPITWNAGSLTGDSFLRVNETLTTPGEQYVMTIRATDAAQGFGFCAFEETIAVNIGSSPRFGSGPGTAIESVATAATNWSCTPNQPLRTFNVFKGFLRDGNPGCTAGCYNTTTGNPIPGFYSNPFPPFANQIPLAESKISGIYNIQNINTNQTDLQAEVISNIVNPGTGYVLGTQLNVTGGSGLNMTVNITGVNGAGGITGVEIANSGTLAPPYGTGPTGYVNGDIVTVIQVGSGNNAELELDGGIVSNAFVVSYEVITPNPVDPVNGNNYQFSPVGTATKSDFEIVHKYRQNGSPCDNNIALSSFTPDYSASAGTGDPTKGYLVFNAPNNVGNSTSIEHVITNIFKESQKNASVLDTIAAPAGKCITNVTSKNFPIIRGTIYFRIKLKAFDPTGKVFGSTANPGTLTGWNYYDNNKLLAEDVLGMVFSDMQSSWNPGDGCQFGINDPRFTVNVDCGNPNTCL
jgi:hypothetical protein